MTAEYISAEPNETSSSSASDREDPDFEHRQEHAPLLRKHREKTPNGRRKKRPWLLKQRAGTTFITMTICFVLFTDSVIYGIMVPVIPYILRDRSDVPHADVQYWCSALFAVFGACILVGSPLCGWYADRGSSRRKPLLAGLVAMCAATVMLGFSYSAWMILLSRAMQGLSTAIAYTVGLALLVDTVGKDDVGKWMGVALSSESVGLVISPLLGGMIYPKFGLWGVVSIILLLIALNAALLLVLVEKKRARKYRGVSRTTSTHAVATYETFGILPEQNIPESTKPDDQLKQTDSSSRDSQYSGSMAGEVQELSTASTRKLPPMMRLLMSPRVMAGAYGVLMQFGLLAAFDAVLPLFVKRTFEWDSLRAGLIFLNLAVPALLGPLAGRLSDRFGPRRVTLVGCVLTTPSLMLLSLITHNSPQQVALLCVLLVLIGMSLTLIIAPLAADLSFAVDAMETAQPGIFGDKGAYGQAYALFTCAMAAAELVGPILAGAVREHLGWGSMAYVLGGWCASVAIPVLIFIGDSTPKFGPSDLEDGEDDFDDESTFETT